MVPYIVKRQEVPMHSDYLFEAEHMRLRSYLAADDHAYIEKWIEGERTHALWSANLVPYPVTKEALNAFLEEDARTWGGCAYMAEDDDGMSVGFFVYSVNSQNNSGFLKFVVLDPAIRGKGYGTQMLRLALGYAFETTGVDFVQIKVFDVNERAIACYTKVGFRIESTAAAALQYKDEQWGRCHMVISRADFEEVIGHLCQGIE